MLYLFIVDGQGGQTVQFQPGGMPGNVLVVACAAIIAPLSPQNFSSGR